MVSNCILQFISPCHSARCAALRNDTFAFLDTTRSSICAAQAFRDIFLNWRSRTTKPVAVQKPELIHSNGINPMLSLPFACY